MTMLYRLVWCCGLSLQAAFYILVLPAVAQEREPIVAVGHGGFFGGDGRQIPVTLGFVMEAQRWYRARLVKELSDIQRAKFEQFEKRLNGIAAEGQDRLLLDNHALEWLLANIEDQALLLQTAGKVRALRAALAWEIPEKGSLEIPKKRERFKVRPEIAAGLQSPISGKSKVKSATVNRGQAYINECRAARVPIPPSINVMDPAGVNGWRIEGLIPEADQFIVSSPAQLRSFQSPEGMCYALPRFTDIFLTTATLDGVICLSRITSKACFWDNQRTVNGDPQEFSIGANEIIPIGVPATPGGKYQAGGAELERAGGGVCTDCHAGENPFVTHPKSNLITGFLSTVPWETLSRPPRSLPTMSSNRYDPLVAQSWPQNDRSLSPALTPQECKGCHVKGSAGRLPHLSTQLPSYCSMVLPPAVRKTMPPGSPGGPQATINSSNLGLLCGLAPNLATADTGDPHITTISGHRYDLQAAGEFTALRDSDGEFEIQTRHSPVLTNFVPVPDPYSGLSSCVSLNSAVALRIGGKRVTYQPNGGVFASKEGFRLRVDGQPVSTLADIDLGDGNIIKKTTPDGELLVRAADGTRVLIIPWRVASQDLWYLDIHVFDTFARDGLMGPILPSDWLPRGPDGRSFGTMPVALADRHKVLNNRFADAWRVGKNKSKSLFDYAPGTSTQTFTDRAWPSPPGGQCRSSSVAGGTLPYVKAPRPDLAKEACTNIADPGIRRDCIFDVTVMGDADVARGHKRADQLKAAPPP